MAFLCRGHLARHRRPLPRDRPPLTYLPSGGVGGPGAWNWSYPVSLPGIDPPGPCGQFPIPTGVSYDHANGRVFVSIAQPLMPMGDLG